MFRTCINFKFTEHVTTKWVFRQHAFNRFFDDHFRFSCLQLFEGNGLQTTRITGVMMIKFIFKFITCYDNFLCIDNDDIVRTVLDLLEGGAEAFEARRERYGNRAGLLS